MSRSMVGGLKQFVLKDVVHDDVVCCFFFFFQAEDGIRDLTVTGVQTCALPIWRAFPNRPWDQLRLSIDAVFASWHNDRAVAYRQLHGIPEDWGTAVNVQAMVLDRKSVV